jgi:K+-sensing histidine kinase KdpD/CheY-like chemotaxis protein
MLPIEMMVGDGSILPASLLLSAVAILALLAGGWWVRERRLREQRRAMRELHALSEDIIAASSPAQIAEILAARLPGATRATSINLYLFNRRNKTLEHVSTAADPEPMAAPLDEPPEGLSSAAVVCFRNRTTLNIPDVRRSPLVKVGSKTSLPRAALFAPLLAHNEVLGVLEVHNDHKFGYFKPEEQAALLHLANQAAASLKLQEQQAIREQLFRSEKLAVTGQLLSGIASDLRAPLDRIVEVAESLVASSGAPAPEAELRRLSAEANRASEIVWRLVSFAREDQAEPQRIDMNALIASLARFREPEWLVLGLRPQLRIAPERAEIAGFEGQLEKAFLNLLVYAEQRAAASPGKTIAIKTSVLAQRLLIEIDYSPPQVPDTEPDPFAEEASAESGAPGLELCLGIVRNHGGDARMRRRQGICGFEAELPLAPAETIVHPSSESSSTARSLTLALVDPDIAAQRALVTLLGAKGHRVIPATMESAADIVQRLRFDAILWSVRAGVSGWSEFQDRFRASIPAFVLIADSYDHDLARNLAPRGGFLLARPIREHKLVEVLREVATRRTQA